MFLKYQNRWLYEADKGNNGGEHETPTADGAGANNKPETGTQPLTFTPEQQAHVDKLISGRLGKAKSKWEDELKAQQDKAEQDAEAKRLEEEKEYQKLLDLERGKIAELEPLKGQLEAANNTLEDYRTTVGEILTAKIEALGEAAKTAIENLPGEPDALGQLKWLNANETLFTKTEPIPKGGTPPRGRQPQRQPAQQNNQQQPAQQPIASPLIRF